MRLLDGQPVTLVSVSGVSKHFALRHGIFARPGRIVRAVEDVSLGIERGETVGLVGESGCGKTTLGRLIVRLETPTAGRIEFDGRDLRELSGRELRSARRNFQIVFQDPGASLNPRMTVEEIVSEGAIEHGLIALSDRSSWAVDALAKVGLGADSLSRYPHEFSGGQRQRINVARAISLEPRFVVCDEPVSALDVSVQAQIINLLMDLKESLGLSYLFISHDLSVVRHIADRIAVMYLGRVVESGPTEEIFANPRHPYTEALLASIPTADPLARRDRRPVYGDPTVPKEGCLFAPRCPIAEASCHVGASPELAQISETHRLACPIKRGQYTNYLK